MTRRIETELIHGGELSPRVDGAATTPIFQCTVFESIEGEHYHDIRYPRLSNLPNHRVLGAKLAILEGGEAALVASSGMAAITTSLLTMVGPGDHLLMQDNLYGGTHSFATGELVRLGVDIDLIDASAPGSWEPRLRPTTKAIYTEAITNPLMRVADHSAIVRFARTHNLVSAIDNTFATAVNFRPLELGYDLSLHSATKYLNGHSDLVAGAVIGSADWVAKVKHRLDIYGGSLDPHACFLFHRGLKTLALRVGRQNDNAQAVAEFLEGHAKVAAVNYPGLASHAQHGVAADLFAGFGGMLSFELTGGTAAATQLEEAAELPIVGPSLGGLETLMTRPARTSHAGLSPEQRRAAGISDGLIRMSVGIEHADDLIADLEAALARVG